MLQPGRGSDNHAKGGLEGKIFLPTAESSAYKQKLQICQSMYGINVLLILGNALSIERNSNNISNHLLPVLLDV